MKVIINSFEKAIEELKVQEILIRQQTERIEDILQSNVGLNVDNTKELKGLREDLIENRKMFYEMMIALSNIRRTYSQCEDILLDALEEIYSNKSRTASEISICFSDSDMQLINRIKL